MLNDIGGADFRVALIFIATCVALWLLIMGALMAWQFLIHKIEAWAEKDPPKNTRSGL